MDKINLDSESMSTEDLQEDLYNKVNNVIKLLMEKPDNSWLKSDIQDWLKVRNVSFEDSDTKTTLLGKV